jgi:hypothetical protein
MVLYLCVPKTPPPPIYIYSCAKKLVWNYTRSSGMCPSHTAWSRITRMLAEQYAYRKTNISKQIYNTFKSPDILIVIMVRRLEWFRHVVRMCVTSYWEVNNEGEKRKT